MAFPDAAEFKEWFDTKQITDERIELYLTKAGNEIKRKVGIEAYNEIFEGDASTLDDSVYLDENVTTTDEEALRLAEVTHAAICYTAASLVLNFHIRLAPGGQMKKQQDVGSLSTSTQVENEYFSISDVEKTASMLRAQGDALITPYVIEQEPRTGVLQVALERG